MGCGIQLMTGEYFRGGTHVSFNRQCWRKDCCTMTMGQFTHLGSVVHKTHKDRIYRLPSISILRLRCCSLRGRRRAHHYRSRDDEVGIAGTLQGQPVEIVKAKTVDAYACAQSEWSSKAISPRRESGRRLRERLWAR